MLAACTGRTVRPAFQCPPDATLPPHCHRFRNDLHSRKGLAPGRGVEGEIRTRRCTPDSLFKETIGVGPFNEKVCRFKTRLIAVEIVHHDRIE